MDAAGCTGRGQAAAPGCAPWCAAATLLLGIPGLVVTAVARDEDDGWTVVDVATAPDQEESARRCPGCGEAATAVKETVITTPRDVYPGDRQVRPRWRKRRWTCGNDDRGRKTFTGFPPAVPARARLTARPRVRLGEAIGDELMPAAAAARRYRVSDRTAAAAFTAYAETQLADLGENQPPVEAAGIDEFRRGIPGPATGGGEARSQWLTHLVDLGDGGTRGLAQGRTGEAGKGLLGGHAAKLRYLAMDLSAPYRPAVPAGVTVIADAFHLVKLANRKIGDAFRRLSYRTGHPHEDPGLPRPPHYMLRHNIESLDPDHLATIITALDGDGDGQQIAAVWIAKEQPRALLALRITKTHVSPAPSQVRDKLAAFYSWCADHHDIPEIKTLAATIGKWQQPVIDAVLTGYSNAKAEAHNRTAKMVARTARGFASPQNQARRVRMATTRAARLARRQPRRRSRKVARAP